MSILKVLRVEKQKGLNYCWVCKKWKKHGKFDEYAEFECSDCHEKRQKHGLGSKKCHLK